MNSNHYQPILFLGNRALKVCESFKEESFKANCLTFTSAIPFSGLKNTIHFNEQKFETDCEYEFDHEIHIWLYPMGMTSLDIRKELARFIYKLKKHDTAVLLLIKPINESIEILKTILAKIDINSIQLMEEKMDGFEFLIGKSSFNLIDG